MDCDWDIVVVIVLLNNFLMISLLDENQAKIGPYLVVVFFSLVLPKRLHFYSRFDDTESIEFWFFLIWPRITLSLILMM